MTVEELRDHLDDRLDELRAEQKDLAKRIGTIEVSTGRLHQTVALKVREADKEHQAMTAVCAARATSAKERISRLERGVLGALVSVLFGVVVFVWDKVTGKAP